MESHLSTAIAVMVPEDMRMLVPWRVGTSLQARRPRSHLPPCRTWTRVAGRQRREVEIPELLRFKI